MKHIKDMLKVFIKDSGLGGRQDWRAIEERWEEFAPEAPSSVKPLMIEKGRLIVTVPDSAVMSDMTYAKAKILARVKKAGLNFPVKEIVLRIKQ